MGKCQHNSINSEPIVLLHHTIPEGFCFQHLHSQFNSNSWLNWLMNTSNIFYLWQRGDQNARPLTFNSAFATLQKELNAGRQPKTDFV